MPDSGGIQQEQALDSFKRFVPDESDRKELSFKSIGLGTVLGLAIVALQGFEVKGLEVGPKWFGALADSNLWAMGIFLVLCYSLVRVWKKESMSGLEA